MRSELPGDATVLSAGRLVDQRVARDLLAALTEVTGLPATIRDADGQFLGTPTVSPRWCQLLRRSDFGFDGCRQASLEHRPGGVGEVIEYTCHDVLKHLTAAIGANGRVVAQIVVGPYSEQPMGDQSVASTAMLHGIDYETLLATRRELRWLPATRARAISRLLLAIANALSRIASDALANGVGEIGEAGQPRRVAPQGAPPEALLVECDEGSRSHLRSLLEQNGFRVRTAQSMAATLQELDAGLPDVALIDPDLLDAPLGHVCQLVRAVSDLPIVVLSADNDEDTVAQAIERYADDWLPKPARERELLARLRRVIRPRGESEERIPSEATDQRVKIYHGRRTAFIDGRQVKLTPKEIRLLDSLSRRLRHPVTADTLVREAWPLGDGDRTQLWVHMRSLRQKIEVNPSSPRYIVTRRGEGYVLNI